MKKTKHQLEYINLIIPEEPEPEKQEEAVPFSCPYYSAFLPKPGADNLFSVLDGLPKDHDITAHAPRISEPLGRGGHRRNRTPIFSKTVLRSHSAFVFRVETAGKTQQLPVGWFSGEIR
jgi:hypothetical protein